MGEMTVIQLIKNLVALVEQDKSIANKKILISRDDEGNGYHGLYYGFTADTKQVCELLSYSNTYVKKEDYDKYVILG